VKKDPEFRLNGLIFYPIYSDLSVEGTKKRVRNQHVKIFR